MNDEQFEGIVSLAAQFESSLANRLQWYLKLKTLWASNYVSTRRGEGWWRVNVQDISRLTSSM